MTSLIPRPSAVLSTAVRVGVTATALLGVPGRVVVLMDRAEAAVTRLEELLDSVRVTADRAAAVAGRADTVVDDVDRVSRLAGVIAADTRGVVAGASEAQEAVSTLVRAYEPALETLRPTMTVLAEATSPREVEALVGLVDRLPPLLDSVDGDMLPLLRKLNEMAPDLHALLESVDDLRRTVAGFPGVGLLRRRGDEQLADEDEGAAEPHVPDPDGRGATRART